LPDVERLVAETRRVLGPIAIMVYATGTNTPDRALVRLRPAIWDELISTNLNGAYYVTQAVLPAMREARAGHLILSPPSPAARPTSPARPIRRPSTA
jgi:serine 3-dehydrogenase (NADP+)